MVELASHFQLGAAVDIHVDIQKPWPVSPAERSICFAVSITPMSYHRRGRFNSVAPTAPIVKNWTPCSKGHVCGPRSVTRWSAAPI
jgi:hypothetical protein